LLSVELINRQLSDLEMRVRMIRTRHCRDSLKNCRWLVQLADVMSLNENRESLTVALNTEVWAGLPIHPAGMEVDFLTMNRITMRIGHNHQVVSHVSWPVPAAKGFQSSWPQHTG